MKLDPNQVLNQSKSLLIFLSTGKERLLIYGLGILLSESLLAFDRYPCAQASPVSTSRPSTALYISDFNRTFSSQEQGLPYPIKRLLLAYPESLQTATLSSPHQGQLYWKNGEVTQWLSPKQEYTLKDWSTLSDAEITSFWGQKTYTSVLKHSTLAEQLLQIYPQDHDLPKTLPRYFEPGRLRNELFFKHMYGDQRTNVAKTLTQISWGTQQLRVSKKHRIDERLKAIYRDLKQLPHRFRKYYEPSAGAYHWRYIKGTQRLSVHSFGAAIDIAVKRSNYWKWTLKIYGKDEHGNIPYKNQFPREVVKIFERYGYIWGGWWYHHDTMHFEYRPELLVSLKSNIDPIMNPHK